MAKLSIVILLIASLAIISTACAVGQQIKVTVGPEGITQDAISFSKAQAGKTFLILPLQFENMGYDAFHYTPFDAKVTIDNVQYNFAAATVGLSSVEYPILTDSVTLKNGGKINGHLAFEVPAESAEAGEYVFTYEPYGDYNIVYVTP